MNRQSVFEFRSYKLYLERVFGENRARTGVRKKAAEWIGCHTAYISLVLKGSANLSLEQAYRLNEFLGHDPEEMEFFLLLVQLERAGSKDLENYFQKKVQKQLSNRQTIRGRLQSEEGISTEDQATYYSKWYYSCIHVMISIPELQSKTALSEYLNIPMPIISETLDFLETRGLAVLKDGRYQIGPRHLHLPQDSPHIGKHHSNWRSRALVALDLPQTNDLHYSVVVTLSEHDVIKIKEQIMHLIKANMNIIKDSKEECTFAFTLDYFQI